MVTTPNRSELPLQATGDNPGTWGVVVNNQVFSILDVMLGGRTNLSVAGGVDVTPTQAQAQNVYQNYTGLLTGDINVILPNEGGFNIIKNGTTGAHTLTVKPTGGTGIVVPQGMTMFIFFNPTATAAQEAISYITTLTAGALTTANATITGGTITGITDLAIADGGTGQSTATAAFNALSPQTTRGDLITRDATNDIRLALGTANQALISNGTDALWGTVAIAGGGTGAVTKTLAFNALSPQTTRGDLISNDGTNDTRLALGAANTLLSSNGTDPTWATASIAMGGTGATTATTAFNALSPQTTRGDVITRGATNDQRLALGTTGQALVSDGTDAVWGAVGIAGGGTGATTKAAGFDALSPTTTRGDLIARGASSNGRVAIGAATTFLTSNGTDPAWLAYGTAALKNTGTSGNTIPLLDGSNTFSTHLKDSLSVQSLGSIGAAFQANTTAIDNNSSTARFMAFGANSATIATATLNCFSSNASLGGVVLTFNTGVQAGTPTGGDKGAGTINVASDYYVNGTAISSSYQPLNAALTELSGYLNSRVTVQFDKTSSTSFSNITGLSVTLVSSVVYRIRMVLYILGNSGGFKYNMGGGTVTATSVVLGQPNITAVTALSTTILDVIGGNVTEVIEGTIVVNAGGTLIPQFAQHSSDVTASSVLVGSTLEVWPIN